MGREEIIEGFKYGIFLLNYDEEEEQIRYKEEKNNIRNENGLICYESLERLIDLKIRGINYELVSKRVQVRDLGVLLIKLKKSKNNTERNEIQVALIINGLRNLKKEIKNMSEQDKETENPNEIVGIVKNIFEFNRQQQRQRLKILTPSQMLSRLPISLAQFKDGNPEKLKNEIRKLLYSFYRSKDLTKISIKVWLTLFKHGNYLYEHWD